MADTPLPSLDLVPIRHARYQLEKPEFIAYLEQAPLSNARRYFELARYSLRQHEKVELMAGAVVGIILGWLLGGGTWLGSLSVGILAFFATLVLVFFIHWLRSPSTFHKAASRELEAEKQKTWTRRQEFVAEQLKDLIREHKQLNVYIDPIEDVDRAAHQYNEQFDYCLRVEAFTARYFASEQLTIYPKKDETWGFEELRPVLDDLLRRLVEDQISLKSEPNQPLAFKDQMSPALIVTKPAYATLQEKLETAIVQKETVELRLQELTKHRLFLEVDTKGHMSGREFQQSGVLMYMGSYDVAAPTAPNREMVERIVIKASLYVRLDNRDGTVSSRVNEITVTLKTKSGDQPLRIPVSDLSNKTINPSVRTEYYLLDCDGDFDRSILDGIDGGSFLRLTLDSPNQEPYCVDLNVDWAKARYTAKEVPCTIRAEGVCA